MLLYPHVTKETVARANSITAVIKIAMHPVKIARKSYGNRSFRGPSATSNARIIFAIYGHSTHRYFPVYRLEKPHRGPQGSGRNHWPRLRRIAAGPALPRAENFPARV